MSHWNVDNSALPPGQAKKDIEDAIKYMEMKSPKINLKKFKKDINETGGTIFYTFGFPEFVWGKRGMYNGFNGWLLWRRTRKQLKKRNKLRYKVKK